MFQAPGIQFPNQPAFPPDFPEGRPGVFEYTQNEPFAQPDAHPAIPLVALALALIALVLVWPWYKSIRRKRLIQDVPTSKVKGVALGLTEVKGIARRPNPITSYLAHAPTVWFSYSIEERWRRRETEWYTDSNGKRRSRTVTKTGWTTVKHGGLTGPFDLQDDTGAILVNPDGAKIESRTIFSRQCTQRDPLYYGKGPRRSIANSTGQRSFTEHAIVVGDQLYVMGSARVRSDIVAAEIAHDADAPMFLISTRDESRIVSSFGTGAWLYGVFGLMLSSGAGVALTFGSGREIPGAVVGALLYLLLLSLLYAMLLYNGLVRVRTRIGRAWAMIEVQLQRRSDLVPRLAAVVKGYADHEREVQAGLARLRTDAMTGRARAPKSGAVATAQQAADGQTALLSRVLAVVEAYPDLKSNGLYLNLQRELSDTEDRIALARSFYNESVTAYNIRIATLPDVVFARLMALGRVPLYEIQAFERRPVQIDLSPPTGQTPLDETTSV